MFALVVFILVYVSVIGSMFAGQLGQFTRDASGGFNVLISSNPSDPVPFDRARAASRVCARSRRSSRWTCKSCGRPGLRSRGRGRVPPSTSRSSQHGPPALDDHGAYADDRAAYAAVLANPNLAIVDKFFLASGNGPPAQKVGDRRPVHGPGPRRAARERTFTVAALGTNDCADNGVLMSQAAARAAFGDRGGAESRLRRRRPIPIEFAERVRGALPRQRRERGDDSQHGARPARGPAAVLRADPRLPRARPDRRHRGHRRDHGAGRARAPAPGRRAARAGRAGRVGARPRSWSSRRSWRSKGS